MYLARGVVGNLGGGVRPVSCSTCRCCGVVLVIVEELSSAQPTRVEVFVQKFEVYTEVRVALVIGFDNESITQST